MSLKIYRPKDAVILGMAAETPKRARKYIPYLSKELRPVGKIFVNGRASAAQYAKHRDMIAQLETWGDGAVRIKVDAKTAATAGKKTAYKKTRRKLAARVRALKRSKSQTRRSNGALARSR